MWLEPHEGPRVIEGGPGARASDERTVLIGGRTHLVATTADRLVAGLVDFVAYRVVVFVIAYLGGVLFALHTAAHDDVTGVPRTATVLYLAATLALLGPATFAAGGQSVGKRLAGLRVVSADGSPLTLRAVLVRETLVRAVPLCLLVPLAPFPSALELLGLIVGFALLSTATHDPQGQSLLDRFAGTLVIRHEPEPLLTPSAPPRFRA